MHSQCSAKDMAGQMERTTFQTMGEEIEKAGNVISSNPPFSPDAFLQALEMVELDFDDDRDKPHIPFLVMSPNLAQKVMEEEKQRSQEEKDAFEKRKQTILDKKFEEYVERENKRKLVD